jgi:integrase
MANEERHAQFQSTLGSLMEQFVEEKRACGYKYLEGSRMLRSLDRFLCAEGLTTAELPRPIVSKWMAKRHHESTATQLHRFSNVRQFAIFAVRLGYPAYVPDSALIPRDPSSFAPRIFTHEEIRKLLHAVDKLVPTARSPLRHLIMPEVFRLLYGCGFRVGEVLRLCVRDVDLDKGILTVREGKFRKDRLVPPAPLLVARLRRYAGNFGNRPGNTIFFPAPHGDAYGLQAVYALFRTLLLQCGIPHAGRGKGPRVHDLRHAFAVHTLLRWYQEGADLYAKLPLLATYLGHQNLAGTQRYLHLTAELFPEVTRRIDAMFGEVIPQRVTP